MKHHHIFFRSVLIGFSLFVLWIWAGTALSAHAGQDAAEATGMEDNAIDADFSKNMEKLHSEMAKLHGELEHKLAPALKDLDKIINVHVKNALAAADNLDIPVPHIPVLPAVPHIPNLPNIPHHKPNFKGQTVCETIQKSYDVKEGTALKLDCAFSGIEIVPASGGSKITVVIEKTAGAERIEDASDILKQIEVSLEQTEKAIVVTTKADIKNKSGKNQMFYTGIKISAPVGTPVTLKNSFGDATVNQMGSVSCQNSFGSTNLSELKGPLEAECKYGSLRISNQNGDGTVHNEFGQLTIDGFTGKLDIDVKYGETKIKNVSNNAQVEGNFSFGKVNLTLPKQYAGSIEVTTQFGEIQAPKELTKKKDFTNQSVQGTLGDGKGRVRIYNKFGGVVIEME